MVDDDALVVIASHLRPEEAGMLRGLLDSAGIPAVVRDEVLSSVNPFLQPIIGGAKLVVRASEAERAFDIVQSAGVVPGGAPDEPVEIPEEEWSRGAEPGSAGEVRRAARPLPSWSHRVIIAAAALILVVWLLAHLW